MTTAELLDAEAFAAVITDGLKITRQSTIATLEHLEDKVAGVRRISTPVNTMSRRPSLGLAARPRESKPMAKGQDPMQDGDGLRLRRGSAWVKSLVADEQRNFRLSLDVHLSVWKSYGDLSSSVPSPQNSHTSSPFSTPASPGPYRYSSVPDPSIPELEAVESTTQTQETLSPSKMPVRAASDSYATAPKMNAPKRRHSTFFRGLRSHPPATRAKDDELFVGQSPQPRVHDQAPKNPSKETPVKLLTKAERQVSKSPLLARARSRGPQVGDVPVTMLRKDSMRKCCSMIVRNPED